jgi:hypothetical protein
MKTLICIGFLVVIVGCSHGVTPPTTPTPTPPAPDRSACGVYISCQVETFRLTGTVRDDDGRPVAAAKVSVRPFLYGTPNPPKISAMTGADGSYSIDYDGMRNSLGTNSGIGTVFGEHPDHETYTHYLHLDAGQTLVQDLRLYRTTRVTAGADTAIVVRPGDSICGLSDEWICRTVRVTSPSAGKVTLSLDNQGATAQTGLETLVTGVNASYRCCTSSTVYDVSAGSEIAVDVLLEWDARDSQSLTLRTSLQPQ